MEAPGKIILLPGQIDLHMLLFAYNHTNVTTTNGKGASNSQLHTVPESRRLLDGKPLDSGTDCNWSWMLLHRAAFGGSCAPVTTILTCSTALFLEFLPCCVHPLQGTREHSIKPRDVLLQPRPLLLRLLPELPLVGLQVQVQLGPQVVGDWREGEEGGGGGGVATNTT